MLADLGIDVVEDADAAPLDRDVVERRGRGAPLGSA